MITSGTAFSSEPWAALADPYTNINQHLEITYSAQWILDKYITLR